jgi:hypothetical protein
MSTDALTQKHLCLTAAEYPSVLVDDNYRECVCFLCVETRNDYGVMTKEERATAFFISVPIDDKASAPYLVTARHVIDESRGHGTLFAKINLTTGGIRYAPVSQDTWFCHDVTDVAVIPFPMGKEDRFRCISSNLFVDENYVQFSGIHPGDEVFFVGLFTPYSGEIQAEPIARFGHISLGLKRIPIKPNSASKPIKTNAYLVETKSWGGESGSPVFHCKWPYSPRVPISIIDPRLLGLLHGHYEIPTKSSTSSASFDLNSGIGVVIPAQAIHELLMDQGLVAQRTRLKAEIDARLRLPKAD